MLYINIINELKKKQNQALKKNIIEKHKLENTI